jgi:hypothetical protein
MEFTQRPNVKEASFYIDLKTNLSGQRNVFTGQKTDQFYPYRDSSPDVSQIFPVPAPH